MNPVSSLVLSLALLLGAAGGVYAYDSAASSTPAHAAVSGASATTTDTSAAGPVGQARHRAGHRGNHRTVVRWAPCPDGSTLEDGVCVTDVVRTVTLPAPAVSTVAHNSGGAAAPHGGGGDDHGGEHEGGHDGGHDGGEHGGGGDD